MTALLSNGHTWWPWVALFLLGAYHGLNPGMGWLFAVSLGLQERSRSAVVRALAPLVLGHALSVGLVVAAVMLVEARIPHLALRLAAAVILVSFGVYRLVRVRHPRWAGRVGMRVGFRDLTLWSFLMSSAHGAGLMLLPILIGLNGSHPKDATARMSGMEHMHHLSSMSIVPSVARFGSSANWLMPLGVHTLGYLLLTALIAVVVYEKLGLAILRKGWFNLDLVWSVALVATGILTLAI